MAFTKRTVWITGITLVAVAAAGCGSSSKPKAATTTSSPGSAGTTTVAPTTSAGGVDTGQLPDTPLTAALNQTYRTKSLAFASDKFGVASGSITAAWYQADGFWAVHYRGLDKDHANGKCPGNSIKTATGFEHVTNSPYGANACAGFTGTILPPGSLFVCGDEAVVYKTQIPTSAQGTLYASLEQGLDDGSTQGITSQATADASRAPTIDPSGCQIIS